MPAKAGIFLGVTCEALVSAFGPQEDARVRRHDGSGAGVTAGAAARHLPRDSVVALATMK
jgi:hypothetical protein